MSNHFNSILSERIVLRRAGPQDAEAVARLAELDSAKGPTGSVLVAEVDGRVIAALTIDGEQAIADPFEWTADLVELLRGRARQLRGEQVRTPRLRPALRRLRVAF
jgi:hypothetical protein